MLGCLPEAIGTPGLRAAESLRVKGGKTLLPWGMEGVNVQVGPERISLQVCEWGTGMGLDTEADCVDGQGGLEAMRQVGFKLGLNNPGGGGIEY